MSELSFDKLPILCPDCKQLIKPGFVFFGEGIPQLAYQMAMEEASKTDCVIIIGTTGEIMPVSYIPHLAKESGAKIIEINPEESNFTFSITDVFIKEKASIAMETIIRELELRP